ncbi:MAG TPA: lipase maturation factor family protein, partial [Puia sp.]|nr:lipase maturation factor family protein [Puia sp.]
WLAELIAPWFMFWPRIGRLSAGIIIVLFQFVIILSGNLSFLNWLTIIPALACFDDRFWSKLLPEKIVVMSRRVSGQVEESRPMIIISWIITSLIVLLSIQPVINMMSPGQIMNTSYDPLDLVNTYGAFGSVGEERTNVVFEGTMDDTTNDNAVWKPYIYKGLPVLLDKMPPQIAPYPLRLDWQMWFASMSTAEEYPWTYHLVWKLLHNDPAATSLFANNPFPDKPPRFIRAELYRYKFAQPGNLQRQWWIRKFIGDWMPVLSADNPQLIKYIQYKEWMK